jgi:hypothetical protein
MVSLCLLETGGNLLTSRAALHRAWRRVVNGGVCLVQGSSSRSNCGLLRGRPPPATSPILYFYCLSQAGLALSADLIAGGHWRSPGHGLTFRWQGQRLADATMTVVGRGGAFHRMMEILGHSGPPTVDVTASLGQVWSALVDVPMRLEGTIDFPRLLPIRSAGVDRIVGIQFAQDMTAGVLLDSYFAVTGAKEISREEAERAIGTPFEPFNYFTRIFRLKDGARGMLRTASIAGARPSANVLMGAPADGVMEVRVGDFPDPMQTLALWWLLLFGLSNAARYYPDRWLASLNKDNTQDAIAIERTLGVAAACLLERVGALLKPASSDHWDFPAPGT